MALQVPKSQSGDSLGGVGGELLTALRAELAEERARKASLESRSLTLAAGASAAAALLLGLGSQYSGAAQPVFFGLLLLGGLFFLGSAISSWRVSRLFDYDEMDVSTFSEVLDEGWSSSLEDFQRYIGDGTLAALETARRVNDGKAKEYKRALGLLTIGGVIIGVELALVFIQRIA